MTVRTPSTLKEHDGDAETVRGRTIWLAVIYQALEDATTKRDATHAVERAQARAWLSGMGKDFREVCALAGVEPDQVRARAQHMITQADAGAVFRTHRPGRTRRTTPSEGGRRSIAGMTLTHDGRTLTLKGWADELGLPAHVVRARAQYGWTTERILFEPVDTRKRKRAARDRGVGLAQDVVAGTGALPAAQISA